jgi:hypothetical protein
MVCWAGPIDNIPDGLIRMAGSTEKNGPGATESGGVPGTRRRRAAWIALFGGYGNVLFITIQSFILVPLVLEMGSAPILIQRVASAYGSRDASQVAVRFASGLVVQLVLVNLLLVAVCIVAPLFPAWMSITGRDASVLSGCFMVAGVGNALIVLNNGVAGFCAAMQRTLFANVSSLVTTILGLILTLGMLFAGYGLWSVAVGIAVRHRILQIANSLFALHVYRQNVASPMRVTREALRGYAGLAVPALLANVGNAAMGKSDVALFAILLRPEMATVYGLTRRPPRW